MRRSWLAGLRRRHAGVIGARGGDSDFAGLSGDFLYSYPPLAAAVCLAAPVVSACRARRRISIALIVRHRRADAAPLANLVPSVLLAGPGLVIRTVIMPG